MKKIFAFFAIAALALSGVSCVKELNEGADLLPEDGTRVTLTVSDAPWVSTRSAYTPGEGVKLTKSEKIGLFYDDGTALISDPSTNKSYPRLASPEGAGSYSFTAPAGTEGKTWYPIVPYSKNLTRARLSGASQFMIKFPVVQFPGQDTFDPATDILVGKPFTVEGDGAKTATIDAFKRLTAPLKVEVTGLDAGEKIYAVTLTLSQKPVTTAMNHMAGVCFYSIGADPDDFAFVQMQLNGTVSNAVSAIYDEGLQAESGCWPVWFSVKPITIQAGCTVTLTVFTADACYTRTAPIQAGTLVTDQINKFSFNIKGDGYTSVPAISQAFFDNGMATTISEKTVSLTATDGVARDWKIKGYNWTGAVHDGGSDLKSVLCFPKGQDAAITIPAVTGNKITKVRLYLAPMSWAENYDFPLDIFDGETNVGTIASIKMLNNNLTCYTYGGIIDIPCPEAVTSGDMAGLKLQFGACTRNDAVALVSRMVLFMADAPKPEGDYYQDFLDGKDIVIGNQTYNIKDEDIAYTLIEEADYNAFKSAVRTNDIVFIENHLTINCDNNAGIVLNRTRPTAVVGRYKIGKGQPFIDMKGKFWQFQGAGMALLNVHMASTDDTHGLFFNSGNAVNCSFNAIDCTLESPQMLFYDQAQEASAVTSFIIDNSIIAIKYLNNRAAFFLQNASKTTELCPMYRKISTTNTVFYSKTTGTAAVSFRFFVMSNLCEAGTFGNHENMEFTFSNNSVYNLAPRIIYSASNAKSVVMDKNVMFGTYSGSDVGSYLFKTWAYPQGFTDVVYPTAETSSLCDNTVHFTATTSTTWKSWEPQNGGLDSWFTISGNSAAYDQTANTLFGTCDVDKFYFPVNTSVVTNGGGATYDTKLWRTW